MLCVVLCFSEIGSAIQPYLEIPSSALRFMSYSVAWSRNNVIRGKALLCPSITVCEPETNHVVFQLM